MGVEMQTICMLFGGPDRRIVDGKGKTWRFEDHPYCGPSVVDMHGDPKDEQPPEGSPFWDAVTHWAQQGKRLANGNWCVWDKPTPQKLRHIGGMYYMLVTDKQASNAIAQGREHSERPAGAEG